MTNETRVVHAQLKPCPFCNSSIIPDQKNCQCSNSACPAFHIKTTREQWNRRAQPAVPVTTQESVAPSDCAICRDLGDQCVECEEGEFRQWADRYFAAADYRMTGAGVFIQDWMRHAYAAWCARGALECNSR